MFVCVGGRGVYHEIHTKLCFTLRPLFLVLFSLREDKHNFFLVVGPLRKGVGAPLTTKQKHFFLIKGKN